MRLILPLLFALSACADFPALEGTVASVDANAAYPDLIPLSPLIAQLGRGDQTSPPQLTARLANLRARAEQLRAPVIPASARDRMIRALR